MPCCVVPWEMAHGGGSSRLGFGHLPRRRLVWPGGARSKTLRPSTSIRRKGRNPLRPRHLRRSNALRIDPLSVATAVVEEASRSAALISSRPTGTSALHLRRRAVHQLAEAAGVGRAFA